MKHAPPRTPTLVNKCMDSRRIRDPESVRQFSIICKCSFCVQGTSQPIRKDRNKTPRSNLRPPRKRGERKRTGRAGGQVGCGTGRLLRKLAAQLKPGFTVRIDISPAMIKISKGKPRPQRGTATHPARDSRRPQNPPKRPIHRPHHKHRNTPPHKKTHPTLHRIHKNPKEKRGGLDIRILTRRMLQGTRQRTGHTLTLDKAGSSATRTTQKHLRNRIHP